MNHRAVVIGAGPVGLAAGARLMGAGIEPLILEAGPKVGHTIRDWAHVRVFTNWASVVDEVAVGMLESSGWVAPEAGEFPTGGDVVDRYLTPLGELLGDRIRYDHQVTGITKKNRDKVVTEGRDEVPFLIRVETPDGVTEMTADNVIDASGTWMTPNPMGAGGLPAIGEEGTVRIRYGIPDVLARERSRYAGRSVMVVGSGHSAANVLLDLADLALEEPETVPIWAIRPVDPSKAYGAIEEDELPARGKVGVELRHRVESGRIELQADFRIVSVSESDGHVALVGLSADGSERTLEVDEIVVATGQRPDLTMTRELRMELDPWLEAPVRLAPLIDPNVHTCLTVPSHGVEQLSHPESGFFTVGIKSYGRAPTFLMATGYKQVESVVAAIAAS